MELDRFAPTLGQNGTPCAILPPNGMFDMQRFCYLICQSTWCQNASKLIYQKGEISFLWDTKNVVYCKFDFHAWRWIGRWQKSSGLENRPTPGMFFPKHPVFHFAPMFHFAPTYYIACILWGVDACVFFIDLCLSALFILQLDSSSSSYLLHFYPTLNKNISSYLYHLGTKMHTFVPSVL